jgi:hypothetical protein
MAIVEDSKNGMEIDSDKHINDNAKGFIAR